EDDCKERRLRRQHGGEHLPVARLGEPEPIGIEGDERRAGKEQQRHEQEDREAERSAWHGDHRAFRLRTNQTIWNDRLSIVSLWCLAALNTGGRATENAG